MQMVEEVVTNGKMEIDREEDARNGTGTPMSPRAPAGGADVVKIGDGETTAEGAAGAKDENSRGTGNSVRAITSRVMTSSSAGTASSTTYLHSSSSRNLSTTSSRNSFPGIVGIAAGAARRSITTVPVMAEAGTACHRNSPTMFAGKDASCIIKGGWSWWRRGQGEVMER